MLPEKFLFLMLLEYNSCFQNKTSLRAERERGHAPRLDYTPCSKIRKKVQFNLAVDVTTLIHTLFNIRTLLYSLTIEQFLMHPFSTCASLHLALVSKIAL